MGDLATWWYWHSKSNRENGWTGPITCVWGGALAAKVVTWPWSLAIIPPANVVSAGLSNSRSRIPSSETCLVNGCRFLISRLRLRLILEGAYRSPIHHFLWNRYQNGLHQNPPYRSCLQTRYRCYHVMITPRFLNQGYIFDFVKGKSNGGVEISERWETSAGLKALGGFEKVW